jgi:hypothetical protein
MTTVVKRPVSVTVQGGSRRVITLDRRTVAAINANRPTIAVTDRSGSTQVQDRRPTIGVGSNMGPQGPQGEPGSGTFQMTAGAGGVSALRVIVAENGVARYPNINDTDDAGRVIGVSFTAAAEGGVLTVQPDGVINEPLWTWSPGPVWCGANGVLTQTQPASPAWLMEVGRARSAASLVVDIQKPIIRT